MAHPTGVDVETDPRITGEFLRRVPGGPGMLTLVGVVHDHPASTYRTRQVIKELDPNVLALELPPISIPLFEECAATERFPPVLGGEMSAAIQAAAPGTAVGIDRPTGAFFKRLGRKLLRERPSAEMVRTVLSNALSPTIHALLCRAAAAIAARTSVLLFVESKTAYDIDSMDSPEEQALDEREQARRAHSFMNAFRTTNRSRASQFEDTVRDAEMAVRLSALREQGDVVAVVGIYHLDSLTERLEADTNMA
jgi:pheromone shutdown protein TraB